MKITDIKNPLFLKDLSIKEMEALAEEIRLFLLEKISKTGGHLSSNLGVVELTLAIHYVFNAPKDKLLFDVGHQSYIHKILTGRAKDMDKMRHFDGISGFQKRIESEYDCFEAGHSSTALASALGFATARDLRKSDEEVVAIVGDSSLVSGLSLEALNQIGEQKRKLIIIFNDNEMSISKPVGALDASFSHLRSSSQYNDLKGSIKSMLKKNPNGDAIIETIHNIKESLKNTIIDSGIFKEFAIDYIGPIDGHDLKSLIRAMETAKAKSGPVVIHCLTKKGKGYKYTENDATGKWHGVGPFDIETGEFKSSTPAGYLSYSKIIANAVEKEMANNDMIVAITPAMKSGSGMNELFANYPERCFDVGIAEDMALSYAAGLALGGIHPFVCVYSSFLQRAYDQLNQEICRMNLPCLIGVDRAGLVGEDGETHHGVFDISFLRPLPHMVIAEGKDASEMEALVHFGINYPGPFAIRYPRGFIAYQKNDIFPEIVLGKWEMVINNDNEDATLFAYGQSVECFRELIANNNLLINLVNCRFIKPIDKELLLNIANRNKPMYLYTDDIIKGGLGDEMLEALADNNCNAKIKVFGIDDVFVKHGSISRLKESLGLDYMHVINMIRGDLDA